MTNAAPHLSTSPEAFPNETGRNAKLRAAGNLARTVVGGEIGEQIEHLMGIFYNTDPAGYVEKLAKAIITEAQDSASPRPTAPATGYIDVVAELRTEQERVRNLQSRLTSALAEVSRLRDAAAER